VIKDSLSYQNYLNNNLKNGVQDYMKHELKDLLIDSSANNMRLKTELSSFLTDIEEAKNDDETVAGRNIHQVVTSELSHKAKKMKNSRRKLLGFIPF
jgi:hypothetical protein